MPVNKNMFQETINAFQEGDVVTPLDHGLRTNSLFYGVVAEVNQKEHKIYVLWNGGRMAQHEPYELNMHPAFLQGADVQRRFKANSEGLKVDAGADAVPEGSVVQNPEGHGMNEPVDDGFAIMKNLQQEVLHEESMSGVSKVGSDFSKLKSRRAVYHRNKGRIYQRSKTEVNSGVVTCPKCGGGMDKDGFSRGVHLYSCPECGWKITSDKLL